jgi:hypothetical protein
MKKVIALVLFLVLAYSPLSYANYETDTEEWCGVYFENQGQSYIRLSRSDLGIGSPRCSLSKYKQNSTQSGTANVALDFTKTSTTYKWKKFDTHLIVIRGKFRNGRINNPRFIRDLGI